MKSRPHNLGSLNMRGKLTMRLRCKCCTAVNLKKMAGRRKK